MDGYLMCTTYYFNELPVNIMYTTQYGAALDCVNCCKYKCLSIVSVVGVAKKLDKIHCIQYIALIIKWCFIKIKIIAYYAMVKVVNG